MKWLVKKTVIKGCELRGDGHLPYLTRYILPRLGALRPMLHVFHRSDADEHHDHPWPFVSIILWRGYSEETHCGRCDGSGMVIRRTLPCPTCSGLGVKRKRIWPGMILYRPATWRHRVVLKDGKPAVTLVIVGKRVREWGFFTKRGWQNQAEYKQENGC